MTPTKYFFGMLFLPFVIPIASFLIGDSAIAGIFLLSMGFGAIPYMIFVGIMIFWIRGKGVKIIRKTTYIAPLIFIPIQAIYLTVSFYMKRNTQPDLTGLSEGLLVSAVYILILGYMYVLVANIGYLVLNKLGLFKVS
ncbi:MAG: hypothetical protein ABW141_14510 [Candidatus Thiodiazotropha endolucinida]